VVVVESGSDDGGRELVWLEVRGEVDGWERHEKGKEKISDAFSSRIRRTKEGRTARTFQTGTLDTVPDVDLL
jgi:hypothetical protein